MIVECEQCSTRFQLDESRVPASGVRVRCSRCKHAFFLKPPGGDAEEAIHDIARQAAADEEPAGPSVTEDLSSSSVAAPEVPDDDDESDWEFNADIGGPSDSEDGSVETPAEEPAQEAFDAGSAEEEGFSADALGAEPDVGSVEVEGLDVGDLDVPETNAADDGSGLVGEDAATDFGGTDSAFDDADSAFGSGDDVASLTASMHEDAPLDEEALESVGASADSLGAPSGDAELGDPESWDFFGEEGPPPPPSVPGFAPPTGDVSFAEAAAMSSSPELDVAPVDHLAESRAARWARWPVAVVGWTLTLALLGAGLWHGLSPTFGNVAAAPTMLSAGPVRARDVELRWIETAEGRRWLAVGGVLESGDRRVLAAPLRAVLLDAEGRALPDVAAPIAQPLDRRQLRELPSGTLLARRDGAADALRARALDGSGPLAFQALFPEVPLAARAVGIEMGEAQWQAKPETSGEASALDADPAAVEPGGEVDGPAGPTDATPGAGGVEEPDGAAPTTAAASPR